MEEKVNERNPKAEFTENKNGVRIKKCCASCKHHKAYNPESNKRLCYVRSEPKMVFKDEVCGYWSISDEIDRIKLRRTYD